MIVKKMQNIADQFMTVKQPLNGLARFLVDTAREPYHTVVSKGVREPVRGLKNTEVYRSRDHYWQMMNGRISKEEALLGKMYFRVGHIQTTDRNNENARGAHPVGVKSFEDASVTLTMEGGNRAYLANGKNVKGEMAVEDNVISKPDGILHHGQLSDDGELERLAFAEKWKAENPIYDLKDCNCINYRIDELRHLHEKGYLQAQNMEAYQALISADTEGMTPERCFELIANADIRTRGQL
jgi:hypothetical protein